MKKTDLAYVAGIIDGEGCIHIRHTKKNKSAQYFYDLQLNVASTDEWLCQYLKMLLGGAVRETSRYFNNNTRKYSRSWVWQVCCQQAKEVLELIIPYLKIKRPQAELAIKFQNAKVNKGKRLTDEEVAIQEAEFILMKNLKKHEGIKRLCLE